MTKRRSVLVGAMAGYTGSDLAGRVARQGFSTGLQFDSEAGRTCWARLSIVKSEAKKDAKH
jgi:hypothetical protein